MRHPPEPRNRPPPVPFCRDHRCAGRGGTSADPSPVGTGPAPRQSRAGQGTQRAAPAGVTATRDRRAVAASGLAAPAALACVSTSPAVRQPTAAGESSREWEARVVRATVTGAEVCSAVSQAAGTAAGQPRRQQRLSQPGMLCLLTSLDTTLLCPGGSPALSPWPPSWSQDFCSSLSQKNIYANSAVRGPELRPATFGSLRAQHRRLGSALTLMCCAGQRPHGGQKHVSIPIQLRHKSQTFPLEDSNNVGNPCSGHANNSFR